jgi:hypothetical protein
MATGLGWIDFSKEHRDRVFSVIDMLGEPGTVDELGIGVIRDALADCLFPGVSTIQTRPKYFIIISNIFLRYVRTHQSGLSVPTLTKWLKDQENQVMHNLAKNYNYKENNGVIGINVARNNKELARKASSVYWNGLRTHGIIETNYSLAEYLDKNDLSEISKSVYREQHSDDQDTGSEYDLFNLKLPSSPNLKQDDITMDLSREEAKFLKDQFKTDLNEKKQQDNLLKYILSFDELSELTISTSKFKDLGEILLTREGLPTKTKVFLDLALTFDFIIHGAHIRYNIMLHQQAGEADFNDMWQEWLTELSDRKNRIESFNIDLLFREIATRTKSTTRKFIYDWYNEIMKPEISEERIDKLVYNQEFSNKGSKSKLSSKSQEFSGWVGINELSYRFIQARRLVEDITNALKDA